MCKRTQQLRALLRPQCWELLRTCWQWCANGCNNSQQCWDLQCIVGRIQPISLCKPCVMSVRGPNNVGRAVQMDPTLLRYASVITEQKKCWESLAQKFYRFQTLHNNSPLHATGSADRAADGQCWDIYLYHNIVVIQIENFPLFFSFARFRVIQLFGMPMSK